MHKRIWLTGQVNHSQVDHSWVDFGQDDVVGPRAVNSLNCPPFSSLAGLVGWEWSRLGLAFNFQTLHS